MDPSETETIELFLSDSFAETFFATDKNSLLFEFGSASDVGLVRKENEDHFAVVERSRTQSVLESNLPAGDLPDLVQKTHLLVVADGMGGTAFGKLASRLVIQTVWDLANKASNWIMNFTDVDALDIRNRLDAYGKWIQKAFRDKGLEDPQYSQMGTTWTSAYVVDENVLIAHVGDSRAYLWDGESLHQLTRDQTVAQDYIDSGIPAESVKQYRHILTNCFGGDEQDARFDFCHVPIKAGNVLLLCTDGLTDLVSNPEIAAKIVSTSRPQEICDHLVQLALDRGGADNVTVVAGRFLEE